MELTHIAAGLLVCIGAFFLGVSIVTSHKIRDLVSEDLRKRWMFMIAFMYFFVVGYLSFTYLLLGRHSFPIELVTGGVFLGGSVFVMIVMNLSQVTISRVREGEKGVRLASDQINAKNAELEREIVKRREVENLLQQAKEEWEDTFNSIDEVITVHDLNYTVVLQNEAARRLFGDGPAERGLPKCHMVYHGVEQPPAHCPSCRVLVTRQPCSSEFFEPHLGRHVHVKALPRLDKHNNMIGVVHIVRDVTDRNKAEEEQKKLQSQFIQAQKMESVGRLAGGVAHDFNNILSVILTYSGLTLKKLAKDDPLWKPLFAIRESGERAAALTKQLLAFSRKQVLEMKRVNLGVVVENLLKMLAVMIGEDIVVAVKPHAAVDDILADHGQIEQILLNLAVNARDAMPSGGRITIETANITLDGDFLRAHAEVQAGPYVMLSVTDTGAGMNPELQKQIFEPFFTTKAAGKGTGLGLATVYGIVKQHNAYVYVDSEPGTGTSFKIYFPAAAPGGGESARPETLRPRRGVETVLVVDDEEHIPLLIETILQPLGYRVLLAASGPEALAISRGFAGNIDVLLTDVIMKEMNGRELATQLQGVRPELKVIFMSGYTDDVIAPHGILERGNSFLQKPLTPANVAQKLGEVLAGTA